MFLKKLKNNMNWPLNDSNFTIKDKLKIASFFLGKNRWTQSKYVDLFEDKMATYVGAYATFVSSGSAANTLVANYYKEKLGVRNVIVPATTWATSVSPFILAGYKVYFCDVNEDNLAMCPQKLGEAIENIEGKTLIFPTSLLGYNIEYDKYFDIIEENDNLYLAVDNCENTFGKQDGEHVCSKTISTTSTYFGHMLNSVEGGFVFSQNQSESDYFRMARNHGMTRGVVTNFNDSVDDLFSFQELGSNFRNSDINAFIGLLDFERKNEYAALRMELSEYFFSKLRYDFWRFHDTELGSNYPFCLPIIHGKSKICERARGICQALGIETRPIISGNLLRHSAFRNYGNASDYKVSEFLSTNGFYIGLHSGVSKSMIDKLTGELNKI